MPACGNNGTDGPLPERHPDTVTFRRRPEVGESPESGAPDVEPTDVQAFARQFRRDSGLK